jgi:hypothetical protein
MTLSPSVKSVVQSLCRWLTLKRVCAWCHPQRRIGGNPLASKVTHGICPACMTRITPIYSHQSR